MRKKIEIRGWRPRICKYFEITKGQIISEWIYEVIVSLKIRTKNCQDFCPHYTAVHRAEIRTIFRSYFGRNDDFINSFWNLLTFTMVPQVELFSFVFWKNLKTPKRPFEINWPFQKVFYYAPIFLKVIKNSWLKYLCMMECTIQVFSWL